MPAVAPVAYVALATDAWREYPFSLLFAADCLIALGLLAAIWVTAREQVAWRRQHSRLLAASVADPTTSRARASEDANEA